MGRRAWPLTCLGVAGWLVVAAAGTGAAASGPRAGEMLGFAFRITGSAAVSDERAPAVGSRPSANEFLVVWYDSRSDSTRGVDIYGRRVSGDGLRIGRDFRISGAAATSSEYNPAVAYNPSADQYLVVWQDGRHESTRGWDIYGRLVSGQGVVVGEDFLISGTGATADEVAAAAVYNPSADQYLVSWWDNRNPATSGSIYGRLVSSDGGVLGEDFPIGDGSADEWDPAMVYSPSADQYLTVWMDRAGSSSWAIYGRLVSENGETVGEEFRISGGDATGTHCPAVAYNPATDQFLVVWRDGREGSAGSIYGRLVSSGGGVLGEDFSISQGQAGQWFPAVAYDSAADLFLVVWQDFRKLDRRNGDIWARLVSAKGEVAGEDFRISGPGGSRLEEAPAVAYNPAAGQFLVVWNEKHRAVTRGWDIRGRRVAG
jgi:hypothetical protein